MLAKIGRIVVVCSKHLNRVIIGIERIITKPINCPPQGTEKPFKYG